MALWFLQREALYGPACSETLGIVVRAATETEARELCAQTTGTAEGPEAWRDAALSSCSEIEVDGEAEIILRDEYQP